MDNLKESLIQADVFKHREKPQVGHTRKGRTQVKQRKNGLRVTESKDPASSIKFNNILNHLARDHKATLYPSSKLSKSAPQLEVPAPRDDLIITVSQAKRPNLRRASNNLNFIFITLPFGQEGIRFFTTLGIRY